MTYTTEIYGAAQDATQHAALATREGLLAALNQDPNVRTRQGVGLVAHGADLDFARAWLAQAVAVANRVEARRARMDAEPITDAECAELFGAIGAFFRSLNVCPYGWKRFRWRMEDLLGAPRNREERSVAGLDASDISEAEHEEARLRGITWRRVRDGSAVWFNQRDMGWSVRESSTIIEEFRDGSTRTSTISATPKYGPGLWRRSVAALMLGATPDQVASWSASHSAVGRDIYFGRPEDIGVAPPGVGDTRSGIPQNLSQWERLPTGESHRVWMTNDGRVFRQPGADALQPFSAVQVVDLTRLPNGDSPVGILDRIADAGEPGNRAFAAGVHQVPIASVSEVPVPELGGRSLRANLAGIPVSPVVVPAEWYWQIFTAPVEGLRLPSGSGDVSLLEYISVAGPVGMIREVLRDTVTRNLTLMSAHGLTTEAALFGEARRADLESAAGAANQVVENGQTLRTTQAAFGVATGIATAINPIAGVIVGAGGLITMAIVASVQRQTTADSVTVDVFGRLSPAWERFAIHDDRFSLESSLSSREMQPPNGVSSRESRANAVRQLERNIAEFATTARSTGDGSVLLTLADARRPMIRTVVLYGLDPVGGARVYANDDLARDITLSPQETGTPARWESSMDHGQVWVFGAPETATRIRVVYPDGAWRTIALRPVPPSESNGVIVERTPQERTAFVDAAPPPAETQQNNVVTPMNETSNTRFPPRTVVLVGMQPGTRVFAQGDDITNVPMLTGDAARWIDSTVPGLQGWAFGVAQDNTRVIDLLLPDGSRRTIALPPLPANASVTERVTTIDLTASPASGQYPSRTVVLVGMPRGSRVFKGGEDITDIPMLTGDAARWIDSTVPGLQGWAFGVADGTRVIEIVTPSGLRIPVTLPPMDPSLAIEAKVTTVDVSAMLPHDTADASAGGGGGLLLLAAVAAAVAAGRYYLKDR